MSQIQRIYDKLLLNHFEHYSQMLFLAGPRQVGKTTISFHAAELNHPFHYLNWDLKKDRSLITEGADAVGEHFGLQRLPMLLKQKSMPGKKPIIVFDEIHKYTGWKNFLKGFYDLYKESTIIVVTGSSRLDVFRRGGDSMMGRYFLYRIHPLSIGEMAHHELHRDEIQKPHAISEKTWKNLLQFGGFPEPFVKANPAFYEQWTHLRSQQLFREDIRDLTRVQELGQLEVLSTLIQNHATQKLIYSNLANKVGVSINSIKRWIKTLESFYYCFTIKPWTKNISRSLLKEPKMYLWDWSDISDVGARAENFIACHLLKAIHFWTDRGFGKYDLFFIRDKDQREVDFLVTKNNKPWFLVEVKSSENAKLSESLVYFQKQTKATHAFQVVLDMDYVDADCFSVNTPIVVPAKTFLSQLV